MENCIYKFIIKYSVYAMLLLVSNILFAQPIISNFSPLSGTTGSSVVIKGTNFSSIPADNIIFLGPVKAQVTWSTNDSLAIEVPLGATHDLIRITVNNLSAFSARKFLPINNHVDTITNTSFAPKVDYTTPSFPTSIALADLDTDGKTEIITSNYGVSNLTVFRNSSTSEIVFSISNTLAVSDRPGIVKAGDINGDGKPDLVTANDITQTVSVFLNNTSAIGAISFAAKQDFPAGTYPVDVDMGDIDNDGKIDLIEINNQQKTVSILRNTGTFASLAFAPRVSFTVGNAPSNLAVIDLDSDGKQDILVTNQYDSTVSLLKNTSTPGNISFLPKIDIKTGYRPMVIDIGDLNNDSLPDIVTGSQDSSIAILKNISTSSTFNFSLENKLIGVTPRSVAIGDINGDAKPDICMAGSQIVISVLQNISLVSNITFADKVLFSILASSYHNKIADINNDGRNDLIVVHYNKLGILKNIMPDNLFQCPNAPFISLQSNITGDSYQWQVNWGSGYVNINNSSTYSGTNTPILQITGFGSSWYGIKYRCLVSGIYSEEYVLKFQNTWTGSSNNNWENPLNWSCLVVPDSNTDARITNGTLTINSNVVIHSLTLGPGVNFTINPGFTLTVLH